MKKSFIFYIMTLLLVLGTYVFASNDTTTYYYKNESGEVVASDTYELDENAVKITSEDDYNQIYKDMNKEEQASLEESFNEQQSYFTEFTEGKHDSKMVVVQTSGDIQQQYIGDSSYVYLIQYQKITVKDEEGKISPAVVIFSYDIAKNKNIKPLKAGDTVYGYMEYVTPNDAVYSMVNHGYSDDEVAFISVTVQDRSLGMILLSVFTILVLLLYTGKHGAKLCIPTFIIIDLLFVVLVPELELGRNMILITALIALELIVLIATLRNGWSKKTLVAIISAIMVVCFITILGTLFGSANGLTGKGIISEEDYDLLTNVYYIDSLMKSTISPYHLYLSFIIIITAVISATIASRITDLCEKYAGTKDMVNSIIEEAKPTIAEYPMIIVVIFMMLYLPKYMIARYNHIVWENLLNAESFVTYLALLLFSLLGCIITAPITAIISKIFMGNVEIKQISGE